MNKRFFSLVLAFVLLGCIFVNVLPMKAEAAVSRSTYDQRVAAFLADSRWKHGSVWNAGQMPKVSTWESYGCCAYCADFVGYVYGEKASVWTSNLFTPYTDINEVRAGDIIHMDGHWIVVLGRDGNKLYTAEGNIVYNQGKANEVRKVRVSKTCWTITGGKFCNNDVSSKPKNKLITGYHYNFADSNASVSFSDYPEKTVIYGGSAKLGITLNKPKGVSVTQYGLKVYDSNGKLLKDKAFSPQKAYTNSLYLNISLHTRDDLGIELTYGTDYKYQFYATVGGKAYTSAMREFRTHYFVRFQANGGSGTMTTLYVHNGKNLTWTKNAFTREGYAFKGWNVRRSDGTWYVLNVGWCTEAQIAANGYSKRVYPDGYTMTMGKAWHEEHAGVFFELYAVWESTQPHQHSYSDVVTAPTCTEAGYTTHTCSCGHSYTDTAVAALGHDMGQWYQTKAPTEYEEGEERRDCSRCDIYEIHTISASAHEHDFLVNVTLPTCEERGYTSYLCNGCGEEYQEQFVEPLGHSYGPWQKIAVLGNTYIRSCGRCGKFDNASGEDNPFTDVGENSRFKTAILWAYYENITSGKTATTFEPDTTVNRAQAVTFLWRAAGCPEPELTQNPFTDVGEGAYYYKAVMWAVENGITSGTTATTFSPTKLCTRGHIAMFLYNFAGKPEITLQDDRFEDVTPNNRYYKAVMWAIQEEITSGKTENTFGLGLECTRAHVVTFLYKYMGKE